MLSCVCRVPGNLSTLCEPAFKVLELPFEPLHFTCTGVAICAGKPLLLLTGMRSTHTYEKANLPAIPHHRREQWNTWIALLKDRFDKKLWSFSKGMCVGLHQTLNILSGYDHRGLTLQFYGYIPGMVAHAQALNTRLSFSSHTTWGTRLYSEQTQAAVLNP